VPRAFVLDVDESLDVTGYRSIWYPYPSDFHEPWAPGPLPPQQVAEVLTKLFI
jgi:hypothetical protein